MYRIALLVSLSLGAISCASKPALSPESSVQDLKVLSVDRSERKTPPFNLSILEELNDGHRLYIVAKISSEKVYGDKKAVLRLSSLRLGDVIGESYIDLGRPNQTDQEVSISVSADGMTDYRLELLWGNEADLYLKTVHTADKPRYEDKFDLVAIRNLNVVKTSLFEGMEDAGFEFSITGELYNQGTRPVERVDLAVGFIETPKDEAGKADNSIPENEENISVGPISLLPGEGRDFKVVLDKIVPKELASAISPAIRVLSVE